MIERVKLVVYRDKNHGRHQSRGVMNDLENVDFIPSNVQSSHQEALLYVFEDNEAVIKMVVKGRRPTLRLVSRTHRNALDWFFDRINLDPKIQIKYMDTKNQLADMLTKGNFTRDEWNRLLWMFNNSHFMQCSEVMSKRTQKESSEERVTAKSRPMMSLITRSNERAPSALSSTASESPVKTRHESQSLLSAQAEMYDRTVKPAVCHDTSHERHRLVEKTHSSSFSEWNVDKTWSSQGWKSDELMDDRTVRPVVWPQRGAPQYFVIEDDETETDLSLGSRSFLHRVNDQVRKRQNPTLKRCNKRQRQTFGDMENVYVFNTSSICVHGEELLGQLALHQKYRRSHNETDVRHI